MSEQIFTPIEREPLITNVIWNLSSFLLNLFVSFYLARYVLGQIGSIKYGIWVLVGSILGYTGLLDFGVSSAIVRYFARSLAAGNRKEVQKIISTASSIFTVIGLVVFALCLILSRIDNSFFKVPQELAGSFSLLLILLGGGVAFSFPGRVYLGILRALERFDIVNFTQIINLALRVLLIIFFLQDSILLLAIIYASLNILVHIIYLIAVKIILPDFRLFGGQFSFSTIKIMGGYGLFTLLIMLGDQFRFYTDSMVIGHFLGTAAITTFYFGNRLVEYLRDVIGRISGPFFPLFSRHDGIGDQEAIRRTYLISSRVVAIMAFLVGGSLVGSGFSLLTVWIGDKLTTVEPCYFVLVIISIPSTVAIAQTISVSYLYGTSRHAFLSCLTLCEGLANLGISIALVGIFGIYGVALGTALPMMFSKGIIQPLYVCSKIGIAKGRYFVDCILMPLLWGSILAGFQLLLYTFFNKALLTHFLIVMFISALIIVPVVYFFYFSRAERDCIWLAYNEWRHA